MSFSNHLRKLAQPVWDAQLTDHPFVLALGKGTLSEREVPLLHSSGRPASSQTWRGCLPQAPCERRTPNLRSASPNWPKIPSSSSAASTRTTGSAGISPQDMLNEPMAPDQLRVHQAHADRRQSGTATEIGVVALPCAWIYCVVGKHLLKNGAPPAKHPYRDWLMLYASPEFEAVQNGCAPESTPGRERPAMKKRTDGTLVSHQLEV